MSEIIFYVGLGLFVIGGIRLLIAAFRTSVLWGIAVLFITPAAIIYIAFRWQDAKGPFKIQILGFLIMTGFAYMNGGISSVTSEISNLSGLNISAPAILSVSKPNVPNQQFRCDGRTHCSQMTSCAEATYFLRNCPNTRMDGDNDGIPCERQWCR